MQVIITSAARKGLRKMPANDRTAMMAKLTAFAENGEGDVKKLVGSDYFRLRHGEWRAIFAIEGDVIVLKVAHRREIYR
ncbi:type II toxin-antitoxin system RelE family toxin [Paracoccus sp. (in: a-proteobacteria)]|uniref:type II toxin-antitoxin system RelE family toxin n=1 Tax=Paracoccus sp. TaxID=267 RepID=UPI003A84035A